MKKDKLMTALSNVKQYLVTQTKAEKDIQEALKNQDYDWFLTRKKALATCERLIASELKKITEVVNELEKNTEVDSKAANKARDASTTKHKDGGRILDVS